MSYDGTVDTHIIREDMEIFKSAFVMMSWR